MTETTATQADPFITASEAAADAPAASEGSFKMEDHIGDVLLFQPIDYTPDGVDTEYAKNRDRLIAHVTVIKPKVEECETFEDVWVLQGRLIRSLKGKVGAGMVLGKLITDDSGAGRPAYDLEDPSDAAKEAARAWYAAKAAPPF